MAIFTEKNTIYYRFTVKDAGDYHFIKHMRIVGNENLIDELEGTGK